jgi:hypothetical protein
MVVELWHISTGYQSFFSLNQESNIDSMKPGRMALPVAVSLAILLLPFSTLLRSEQIGTVDMTVLHLINYVSESDLTFIRNSDRYTSVEAADHMNKKYRHFKEDINTAEEFIDLCASRSLLSGKPYIVINEQGEQVRTSEWLQTELADYRARGRDSSQ